MIVQPGSPFPIVFSDSNILSAFGRLNTNEAQATFISQQQYGDDTSQWETLTSGTGLTTFLPNESTIQLSTGGTASGASVIRQSRLYHRYIPAHGQTIEMTFVMDSGPIITNNIRRVGYFDSNNGIYLEVNGTTVNICLRSDVTGTPVNTVIPQSSWNVDTFGASTLNPSGITINWLKAQIFAVDLQWLGVGRVRVGFNINGIYYPAHYFDNANNVTTVYMTTANLPVRYENINTGTASNLATLRHICSSVTTDGGAPLDYGHSYSANNGAGGLSITNGSRVPVLSLQAKTTGPNSVRNTGQIMLSEYDVAVTGSNSVLWELILNPTLTGASFTAYNSSISIANIDTSATAVSGGTVLNSGYLTSTSQVKATVSNALNIKQYILAYSGLLNHQDTLSLVCTAVGTTSVFSKMTWIELW